MLVAISGSQGSGKTTILTKLATAGFNVVERKTSRSILQEWDIPLSEVNGTPELTVKFQTEILKRKYQDELHAIESDEMWFTERTYADLFTYCLIALGLHNSYNDWLNEYHITCTKYNQYYASVFYLNAGHFNTEHDGVRGSNVHYSRMVDVTMLDVTQQMIHPSRLSVIRTPDLTQRMNTIILQSQHL